MYSKHISFNQISFIGNCSYIYIYFGYNKTCSIICKSAYILVSYCIYFFIELTFAYSAKNPPSHSSSSSLIDSLLPLLLQTSVLLLKSKKLLYLTLSSPSLCLSISSVLLRLQDIWFSYYNLLYLLPIMCHKRHHFILICIHE